eukprot:4868695-Lingulodinium_polyedra.AAC.1
MAGRGTWRGWRVSLMSQWSGCCVGAAGLGGVAYKHLGSNNEVVQDIHLQDWHTTDREYGMRGRHGWSSRLDQI